MFPLVCQNNMLHWSLGFISHTHICKTHCSLHHNSRFKNRLFNNHPWQTIPGDKFEDHHSSYPKRSRIRLLSTKKSSIMLHFGVTHKLLAFWNWEVYNQVSYVSHLLFDVSEPCTTQIVPACGTAELRWSSPGQEQVCKSWCTLPCHKHWNLLLPPLPPSFPLWRSQFLKLFNFLMWGV